jgi:hypothetical protein
MEGLLKNVKLSLITAAINNSTGSTDTTGVSYVDMAGFDGCLLVGIPSEVIATAIMGMYPYTGVSVAAMATGSTDVYAGTTSATTSMEEMVFALDLIKPSARYISARWDKLTAASGGAILAIQYNAGKNPVAQSTELYGCFDAKSYAGAT